MSGTTIARVRAWPALDSRGSPTVACEMLLSDGAQGVAIAPSGASTGRHEAVELRDDGVAYGGRGVLRAVGNVNDVIAPAVVGLDAADQAAVDAALTEADGGSDFSRLGANAALSVSVAAALAAADAQRQPLYRRLLGEQMPVTLPMPMVNVLSGGAHAHRALDFQDFLVIPVGADSFGQAIEWSWRVRSAAVSLAEKSGLQAALVADEGGLGLALGSNRAALEFLSRSIEASGLAPGSEAAIGIDVAATQFYDGRRYRLATEDRSLTSDELIGELAVWCSEHPVVSLEDPLAEDDWSGWQEITQKLGDRVQLIGDDLFVTHLDRLGRGICESAANAILVKPNQRGTLSQSRQVLDQAQRAGFATVVSARSGETEQGWLADLAIGWRAGQIKVGSLTRSERTAKWNRLLRIESDPQELVSFAGWSVPRPGGTEAL